ncbi:MAG TPA: hypothetical protein DDW52_07550 [Planctomycetaceae bacterium]|nr:hypothetical protein [Planctomycetaceae bacterium]
MRFLTLSAVLLTGFFVGCEQPEETIPTVVPYSGEPKAAAGDGTTSSGGTGSGATGSGMTSSGVTLKVESPADKVRFVADTSLHVEGMMCPYSCWPRVKETLQGQPGVSDVQLAEQPSSAAEGTITKPVVELKLDGSFDSEAAIAALAKEDFAAKLVN